MTETAALAHTATKRTCSAYIWTNVLSTPFWAIFNMLPFILYKDLGASVLQITMMIILKPAVSLVSLYWSSWIEQRADRLLPNLVWAKALAHLPFLFFPFVDSPWFFIAAFGLYMMLFRGTVPTWMEILKLNVPQTSRERIFAYGSAFKYLGTALLPFALGPLMDAYFQSWRWIFPATAVLALGAIVLQLRIPMPLATAAASIYGKKERLSTSEWLAKPWKSAWKLIGRRPDFLRYQLGFMLGGSGLIIMQPALPLFFIDRLHLSYTELAVALTLCKGIGYASASPAWAKLMNKLDIFRFNSWVTALAALFPLFLIGALSNIAWLYAGYCLYGMMQAGSEMSWHLSGPLFAKDEESSVYSNINVLTVGLRGCFIPIIGTLLCYSCQAVSVMLVGSGLCLLAMFKMADYSRRLHAPAPLSALD
jgi:hypothetical protein